MCVCVRVRVRACVHVRARARVSLFLAVFVGVCVCRCARMCARLSEYAGSSKPRNQRKWTNCIDLYCLCCRRASTKSDTDVHGVSGCPEDHPLPAVWTSRLLRQLRHGSQSLPYLSLGNKGICPHLYTI